MGEVGLHPFRGPASRQELAPSFCSAAAEVATHILGRKRLSEVERVGALCKGERQGESFLCVILLNAIL